ncbi:MAG: RES domain-containing protein [Actinobacteria bacterium]|nr:RES domain-containing protein [Actinomycetota bacterium]
MILHRCFAWSERARPTEPDGPLWFPRIHQGDGRHDNPDVYGCLYVTDREASAVVEQLARFRGQRLIPELLVRRGLTLGLASIELPDRAQVIDLDDPAVLSAHDLRPSLVATRQRDLTQPQALGIYRQHRFAAGLRWWSVYEALWANVTVFERASRRLTLAAVRRLSLDDPAVLEAAAVLGLTP